MRPSGPWHGVPPQPRCCHHLARFRRRCTPLRLLSVRSAFRFFYLLLGVGKLRKRRAARHAPAGAAVASIGILSHASRSDDTSRNRQHAWGRTHGQRRLTQGTTSLDERDHSRWSCISLDTLVPRPRLVIHLRDQSRFVSAQCVRSELVATC